LFEGTAGSDARAAVFRGFDHQYAGGHAADDPVADGKVLWSREGSDRELGDQRATESHDLLGEPRVFLGVHDVNSGAEDGGGFSLGSDGAAMRRGIDAARPCH
jgi:hypothetical protein